MMPLEELLVFLIDGLSYSINSSDVLQIQRVPKITQVPLTNSAIVGVCAIEGAIVPIIDVKMIVSSGFVDLKNDKSRLITIKLDRETTALLVDEVVGNIFIEPSMIEYSEDDTIDAVIKYQDNIIQLLSCKKVLKNIQMPTYHKESSSGFANRENRESVKSSNSQKFLIFSMGCEKFCINVDMVREVICEDRPITKISKPIKSLLGMITLRNRVIVVVNLVSYFNMQISNSENSRILIIKTDSSIFGALVDSVNDIRDFEVDLIEYLPNRFNNENISGVIRHAGDIIRIIDEKALSLIVDKVKDVENSKEVKEVKTAEVIDESVELVLFSINSQEYALNIENVEEIIRFTQITKIAESPKFIMGIINLRGQVIPIIALDKMIGGDYETLKEKKILVCKFDISKVGFVVDDVTEVMFVKKSQIFPNESRDKLISDVILLNDGKKVILKIDANRVIQKDTLDDFIENIRA